MALPHTTLIIIIAVAAGLGGLLLALCLYRLLRLHNASPVPLPPKQELARYREHTTHVSQTWDPPRSLSAAPSSKSSLMYPPDSPARSPIRHPSFIMSESPSEDISHFSGTTPMEPSELQLPNLPFDPSRTSLSTSETAGSSSSSPPLPSASEPSLSHGNMRSTSSRPHRRGRPLSVGSTGSSAISRNSRNNTGRPHQGIPHGPFSQVQIVLPAPLAFDGCQDSPSRLSIVDQWAPRVVRSEERRSSSVSEPRKSTSRLQPPINVTHTRRVASASASVYNNRDYPQSPPPVPQIPEQWNNYKSVPDPSERGRPQPNAELPPQPVDRPPPPEKPSKLQRRRSRSAVV